MQVCPFPGPLATKSRLLLGIFVSTAVGISGFPASSAPSLRYTRQKENTRTHHHVILWVSRFLASLPSLHLSKSFYVCFIYNAWGFQLYLVGVHILYLSWSRNSLERDWFLKSYWEETLIKCIHSYAYMT